MELAISNIPWVILASFYYYLDNITRISMPTINAGNQDKEKI
jgi:hypothetical protein